MIVPFDPANREEDNNLGQYRRLAQVLTVTRDMLELANQGEWDQVTELEQQRREDLQHCFGNNGNSAISQENAELIAEALATMLHLNEELMDKLSQAREDVLQQGARQRRNRSAIVSYDSIRQSR